MKAILIDSTNREVKEVTYDHKNSLKDIYKLINCTTIEVALYINDKDDCIYVDEEGLFKQNEKSMFFTYEGGHQPFIGCGLIVGTNMKNGENADVTISLEEAKAKIKFYTLGEVMRKFM